MGKRVICLILALCMMLGMFSAFSVSAAESGKCGDNLTWTLYDNGTINI